MLATCKDRCRAAHVALAAAIALLVASLVGQAHGSGYGRVVHRNNVVVANQAVVPYPVIGYQVGQHLQQAAVDEYGFRNSPSQQRLIYLEGAHATAMKFLESGLLQNPDEAAAVVEAEATAVEETPAVEEPVAEPTDPPLYGPQLPAAGASAADVDLKTVEAELAAILPTWASTCAKCHSGDTPKGDTHVGEAMLDAIDSGDIETLEHYRDLVATGKMPKGTALDDATQGALLLELQRAKQ